MNKLLFLKARVLINLLVVAMVLGLVIGIVIGVSMVRKSDQSVVIKEEVIKEEVFKEPVELIDGPTIAEEPMEVSPLYPLTPQERIWVEQVVASEVRGESIEGIMAVAQTIRDRAVGWDQTIQEVIFAPGQYANPYSGSINMNVKEAVSRVFDDNESVYEEPITHFYNYKVCDPWWSNSKKEQGKIGNHVFLSSIYGG